MEIRTDLLVERLNLVEKENNYLKEKLKRVEEEKMKLELDVADVVDLYKIQMNALRLKIKRLKNMPLIMRLGIIMPLGQLLPYL